MIPPEQVSQEAQKQSSALSEAAVNSVDIGTEILIAADVSAEPALTTAAEAASALADGIPEVASEGVGAIGAIAGEFFASLFWIYLMTAPFDVNIIAPILEFWFEYLPPIFHTTSYG